MSKSQVSRVAIAKSYLINNPDIEQQLGIGMDYRIYLTDKSIVDVKVFTCTPQKCIKLEIPEIFIRQPDDLWVPIRKKDKPVEE